MLETKRVYRCPILKSTPGRFALAMFITMSLCLLVAILEPRQANIPLIVFCTLLWVFIPGSCLFSSWYVETTNEQLSILHAVYPFLSRRYDYNKIQSVEITQGFGYLTPHIRIYLKSGKRPRLYAPTLVEKRYYQALVDDLRERGVKVSLNKMKGVA